MQRQYDNAPSTGNGMFIERPPDEAAAALGRQLALTLQSMMVEQTNNGAAASLKKGIQEKMIMGLSNGHVNPSVAQHFFSTLLALCRTDGSVITMEWLPAWILHCETACLDELNEHTSFDALTATIRAYAQYHQIQRQRYFSSPSNNNNSNRKAGVVAVAATATATMDVNHRPASLDLQVATTYYRLQSSAARICMLREFTNMAFRHVQQIRTLLSPLMAASVLTLSTHPQECLFFLEGIWRECWSLISKVGDDDDDDGFNDNDDEESTTALFDILEWMTKSLQYFLWGLPLRPLQDRLVCKELGQRWLVQLLDLASFLSELSHDDDNDDETTLPGTSATHRQLAQWLETLLGGTLPSLCSVLPSYRIAIEPALIQAQTIIQRIGNKRLELHPVAILRLASIAMADPQPEHVRGMLSILSLAVPSNNNDSNVRIMLQGLASMYLRDEVCMTSAKQILQSCETAAAAAATTTPSVTTTSSSSIGQSRSFLKSRHVVNIIQFLDESIVPVDNFLNFLSRHDIFLGSHLSSIQQNAALLLGVGLLETPSRRETAYTYLSNLLQRYSHLGISLLPVIVDSINAASLVGDGDTLIRQLEFLCDAIVVDNQCAREIWNLLGVELMKPTIPTVIRASVIRLFPKVCAANKRLYKRVIEALGMNLGQPNPNIEIQLAVAATVADLAREDRIRDVTDVIGWIQSFIVDFGWIRRRNTVDDPTSSGNAALVHLAIMSLHYLVVAQELDFQLVIVVLKKRLCDVHDINVVLKLPPVVLEALTLLLGDGECESASDDEEDGGNNNNTATGAVVSPQVSKSVDILISLAHSETTSRDGFERCRRNILQSLSGYSLDALGVDEGGLRSIISAGDTLEGGHIPPLGKRYLSLRSLIEDGLSVFGSESRATFDEGKTNMSGSEADAQHPIVALVSKLLRFEEEVLGSELWQKRGKLRKGPKKKIGRNNKPPAQPGQAEALPSSTSLQQIYNENRSTATALAVLLCFEGKPLSLLTDIAGDIQNESPDPLIRVFTVQAWLNAARRTLTELVGSRSNAQGLEQILLEIREWQFRLDTPDNMYLALAAMALYIPETIGQDDEYSASVQEICGEVWDAYQNHEFESADIGKICLGMIGVCAVQSRSIERLEEIVESLEKSVTGYGGQTSFGAYYGLAVIAQAMPALSRSRGHEVTARNLACRIVGFLVSEIVTCIKGNHASLNNLVACIKKGEISPEIIDSLTALRKKSLDLLEPKKRAAKSLFIGFALCLPALTSVNDELLLGVYCLLESLKWGSGKGMALPSVLRACRQCGLLDNDEIEKIYAKYARVFEEGMDKGFDGLDDIFYAVTATMTKTIPYSIRRFLVGNRSLFPSESDRAVTVLSAVVSLSSLPCLGCGAELFTDSSHLSKVASKEDVKGVADLLSEGAASRDWNMYSQVALLLMGFMASMNTTSDPGDSASLHQTKEISGYLPHGTQLVDPLVAKDPQLSQLPSAQQGSVLEAVLSLLAQRYYETMGDTEVKAKHEVVRLIGCLEGLSLPGHFADFLEQMLRSTDDVKTACAMLLVSQIRGRPRAVFDGREYVELALRIVRTPVTALRSLLGQGEAPTIFIESLAHLLPKFPSDSVEEVIENIWRLCINQVGILPALTTTFLSTVRFLLKSGSEKQTLIVPKTLIFLRLFVLRRIFAGIRDAPWSATNSSSTSDELSIVQMYASCLMEIPITSLMEAEFFSLKDLDGFVGEALRNRCVMTMVRLGYFTTPSRASSEISSSIAWFSRQLISSEDEIFSSTLLQVCCTIAEATSVENADRKREVLLTLLDNLLLTGSSASFVGLQMLSALVGQWCNGAGADGDLSLACLCVTGMEKWQALSPPTLQQLFHLLVHDLPFNLAAYCHREKLAGVVFNRLWRIYIKWMAQGADQETVECVRKALICCRTADSGEGDFASLAISMLH